MSLTYVRTSFNFFWAVFGASSSEFFPLERARAAFFSFWARPSGKKRKRCCICHPPKQTPDSDNLCSTKYTPALECILALGCDPILIYVVALNMLTQEQPRSPSFYRSFRLQRNSLCSAPLQCLPSSPPLP